MDKPPSDAPSTTQRQGPDRPDEPTAAKPTLATPAAPDIHKWVSDAGPTDDGELFEAGYGHGV